MFCLRFSRPRRSLLAGGAVLIAALATPGASTACVGDCAGAGRVTIANLIVGVSISLGNQPLGNCESFDDNGNGTVGINELILGVNNALDGCPATPTPSPTPQVTPTVGGGVTPSGEEFQVNTYTSGGQSSPAAAAVATDFAVVWQSQGEDGDDYGVFARRFAAAGTALDDAGQVNQVATSAQRIPAVAGGADGFVVVWASYGQDGDGDGVVARRFAATGEARGSEFAVNQFTTRDQGYAAVASQTQSGSFLVVWESNGQDGNGRGVFGRRYAADGTVRGDEFVVNAVTTGDQRRPVIAPLGDGGFAVAWMSNRADAAGRGVVARRLAGDGSPAGSEFAVNTYGDGDQAYPAVAALGADTFVVAWESEGQDGDGRGVFAKFFDNAGTALGSEFQLNSTTSGDQRRPRLAADGDDGFVALWESPGSTGPAVFGQRFDSRARARGDEFAAAPPASDSARRPDVAVAPGGFVVVWETYDDGDSYGVAARRFEFLP